MRRPTLKRLMLGLVQQTAALLLLVAIAAVLFNSLSGGRHSGWHKSI